METLLEMALANAVFATVLAAVVAVVTRAVRRPPVACCLWLLVLLKLITPPLVRVPLLVPLRSEPPVVTRSAEPAKMLGLAERAAASPAALDGNVDRAGAGGISAAELSDVLLFMESGTPDGQPGVAHEDEPAELGEHHGLSGSAAASVANGARDTGDPSLPTASEPLLSWAFLVPLLTAVWLAGSAAWLALAIVRMARFEWCRRRAAPAPEALREQLRRLAATLGLRCCPQVCVVRGRVPPLLWSAGGRPTILLPAELLASLDHQQRAMLLAHELAHFRRRDHWVRWLEILTLGLYWWHPVVWWARRELQRAEEQCCDAWVVWLFPGQVQGYAKALLQTVDFLSQARPVLPVAASGFGQVRQLKRRFQMILHDRVHRRMSWPMTAAVVLVALAVLPLSTRLLWAEPSGDPKSKPEAPPAATPTTSHAAAEEKPVQATAAMSFLKAFMGSSDDVRVVEGPSAPVEVAPVTPTDGAPYGIPGAAAPVAPTGSPPAGMPGAPAPVAPGALPSPTPPGYAFPGAPGFTPNAPSSFGGQPLNAPTGNVEQRLQRLEAMTAQILRELQEQRAARSQPTGRTRSPASSRRATELLSDTLRAPVKSIDLAELQRLRDSMAQMEAQMADLSARMADLQARKMELEKRIRGQTTGAENLPLEPIRAPDRALPEPLPVAPARQP